MRDKVILITGGTGTFGKAFASFALARGARQVRIFSRDELKQAEMSREFADRRIQYLCGDVRDYDRLLMAMDGVDIVIHAAAMKRIEKCELDPQEAVKTNVLGSMNVANVCLKSNVKHAIAISSDKAVYPINTYGKTKAVMESLWLQSNVYRGKLRPTMFSAVRYGNVVGSRGSVLHIFRDQASRNGMIVLNHPEMTRFFMSIEEACRLVDFAIKHQQGGEIFVPRMKSASIAALATVVAPDAKVMVTEPGPGEKLHEVLYTVEEADRAAEINGYTVVHPDNPTWPYKRMVQVSFKKVENSFYAERYSEEEIRQLVGRVA